MLGEILHCVQNDKSGGIFMPISTSQLRLTEPTLLLSIAYQSGPAFQT
jgi:hypothetical protein